MERLEKVTHRCTDASWVAFKICYPTDSLTSIYAKLQVAGTTITLDAIDQNGAVLDHVVLKKSAPQVTLLPESVRIVDTRSGSGKQGAGLALNGYSSYRRFTLAGQGGIPSNATARICGPFGVSGTGLQGAATRSARACRPARIAG